jgi:hypothetical protein
MKETQLTALLMATYYACINTNKLETFLTLRLGMLTLTKAYLKPNIPL